MTLCQPLSFITSSLRPNRLLLPCLNKLIQSKQSLSTSFNLLPSQYMAILMSAWIQWKFAYLGVWPSKKRARLLHGFFGFYVFWVDKNLPSAPPQAAFRGPKGGSVKSLLGNNFPHFCPHKSERQDMGICRIFSWYVDKLNIVEWIHPSWSFWILSNLQSNPSRKQRRWNHIQTQPARLPAIRWWW